MLTFPNFIIALFKGFLSRARCGRLECGHSNTFTGHVARQLVGLYLSRWLSDKTVYLYR